MHREQPLGADRLGHEVGDERRVDPARQAEDGALEARLLELAPDELGDDPPRDVGVDRQLGRQLERRARPPGRSRSRPVTVMPPRSSGSDGTARGGSRSRSARTAPRPATTSRPGSAPGSAVVSSARPARSATIRRSSRTLSSSRSSRSSGSAIRSRRMSAGRDVDREQPLVVERGAEDRLAVRRDDLRAAPERDRLVDADPVAEDRRTTSSAGRRSASASATRSRSRDRPRWSPPGRGPATTTR